MKEQFAWISYYTLIREIPVIFEWLAKCQIITKIDNVTESTNRIFVNPLFKILDLKMLLEEWAFAFIINKISLNYF